MVYLKFPNNIVSTEALILAYMYINCTSACLENQAYDRKNTKLFKAKLLLDILESFLKVLQSSELLHVTFVALF